MAQSRSVVSIEAAQARRKKNTPKMSATKAAMLAAEAIRARILEGLLSPGQRLIEADLMDELDVGRSTIREAFLKLDADGLVELRHQRGAVVRRLTRHDMAELFEIRERLEGLGAALCAANIDAKGNRERLLAARKVWRSSDMFDDSLQHMDENVVFHRDLIVMSDNQRLMRIIEPLQIPGYRMQFLQMMDEKSRAASANEHLAIIEAVLAGDTQKSERLMREHVRRAGKLALQMPGLLD